MSIPNEQLQSSKKLRFGVQDAATGKVSDAFKVVHGRNDDDLIPGNSTTQQPR